MRSIDAACCYRYTVPVLHFNFFSLDIFGAVDYWLLSTFKRTPRIQLFFSIVGTLVYRSIAQQSRFVGADKNFPQYGRV